MTEHTYILIVLVSQGFTFHHANQEIKAYSFRGGGIVIFNSEVSRLNFVFPNYASET